MVTILSDSTLLAKKKATVRRLHTFTSNFILLYFTACTKTIVLDFLYVSFCVFIFAVIQWACTE